MSNKILYVLTISVLILVVYGFYSSSQRKEYITELEKLSPETSYSVGAKVSNYFGIAKNGVLGDFYTCARKYRPVSSRVVNGNDSRMLNLKLKGGYVLSLSISGGEAFQFSLERKNDEGKLLWRSSGFALNCELSLLN